LVAEFADDAARKQYFYEEILVQHHVLALVRSEGTKWGVEGKIFPSAWMDKGLEIRDGLDLCRKARRSIEAIRRSPVMDDQHHVPGQSQGLEPRVEIPRLINESIRPCRRRPRLSHAHHVRGQTSSEARDVRDDVAPQVGRRRIAVQKHDGIAAAGIYIADFCIE